MDVTVVTVPVTVIASQSVVVVTSTIGSDQYASIASQSSPFPTSAPNASPSPSPETSSSISDPSASQKGSSNTALVAAVAGGIVGGFCFFTLVLVLFCLTRRHSKRKGKFNSDLILKPPSKRFALATQNPRLMAKHNSNSSAQLYDARQTSGSEVSFLMPLIATTKAPSPNTPSPSDLRLSQTPTHSSLPIAGTALYTPTPSFSGSMHRYSLVSGNNSNLQRSSLGYDQYDPYDPYGLDQHAAAATYYDPFTRGGDGTRQSLHHLSVDPCQHLGQAGISSSRPISAATKPGAPAMAPSVSQGTRSELHQRSSFGPNLSHLQPQPAHPNSAAPLGDPSSSNPPSRQTIEQESARPVSQLSADQDEAAQVSKTQKQLLAAASRPPVAGDPERPSTLSTIPGSISETSNPGIYDGRPSANGTVSMLPRLPSIPSSSSPLIVSGGFLAPFPETKAKLLARSTAEAGRGTMATSHSGSGTIGTGTFDSTGTYNSITGLKKEDLQVIGTLSSQASSLPPPDLAKEHIAATDGTAATTGANGGHNHDHAKRNEQDTLGTFKPFVRAGKSHHESHSSIDSQGMEFWVNKESGSPTQRPTLPEQAKPKQPASGATRSAATATVPQPTIRQASNNHPAMPWRPASSASLGKNGSRMIEMLDTSDLTCEDGDDLQPAAINDTPAKLGSAMEKTKSGQSLANLFRLSPKGKNQTFTNRDSKNMAQPGGTATASLKRQPSSPLNALGFRFGKSSATIASDPLKASESQSTTTPTLGLAPARSPGSDVLQMNQGSFWDLEELPPLDLGSSLTYGNRQGNRCSNVEENPPLMHVGDSPVVKASTANSPMVVPTKPTRLPGPQPGSVAGVADSATAVSLATASTPTVPVEARELPLKHSIDFSKMFKSKDDTETVASSSMKGFTAGFTKKKGKKATNPANEVDIDDLFA